MSTPSVMRIFFAIDLPQAIKEKIGQYVGNLKKRAKSNAIRWTKTENLHITLQFLAEINSDHLGTLLNNVKQRIEGKNKKFTFKFGSIVLFPNPYRPRVIVLEIEPQEKMAEIAALIGSGIELSNYAIEKRPFHGHLTLGRIKHHGTVLNFLTDVEPSQVGEITINEVVLFRSDPQPDGSKYTALDHIHLENQAPGRVVN